MMRKKINIASEPAKPVNPCAKDHSANVAGVQPAQVETVRHRPIGICINAYDQKKADDTSPCCTRLNWKSFARTGSA